MPHLYLVDGSGYIFRAYHRLPPLTDKHGEPVGDEGSRGQTADFLHAWHGPLHALSQRSH